MVLEDTSVPATVVIEKVTQGTLATPVALNSITRQIEVTLNIDPGTQLLEKVTLLYRGEEIASQELSPAQVAEIRAAMASDSPEEQVLRTITFSWETDRYMIDDGGGPITGTATAIAAHTNGQGPLQAVLAVNDGSSSGTAVNSAPLDLTLRNLNGFHLKLDRTGSTATALDVMGFEWRGRYGRRWRYERRCERSSDSGSIYAWCDAAGCVVHLRSWICGPSRGRRSGAVDLHLDARDAGRV